jgi:hypothetical protein
MQQGPSQVPRIFLSYRREDSTGYARALYERLSTHFGDEQIFMDLDRIEPGEDFVQAIEGAVGSCEILIALIGRSWLTSRDETGRRLDDPNDFVRLEITAALARDVPVIPALVQGAQMPRLQDLPEVLRLLSRRQALDLSDQRWNHDVEKFISTLENILARRRGERGQPQAHEPLIQPFTSVPAKSQGSDYKPDELATKVLRYIYRDEGINPVEDLPEQLKVDPLEIEVRLDKLIKHGYVDYKELVLLRGNNPYSLTPEGKEFLSKPDYKGIPPFPSRESPRVLRYANAHRPDDVDSAILLFLYAEDVARDLREITEVTGLNPQEVRFRMNRLIESRYVYQLHQTLGRSGKYRLTDEGVEYVLWLKSA